MRRIRSGCCARAARGHPAAAPPTSVMNSRRLTGRSLKQRVLPYHAVGRIMHHSKFRWLMSALGQKRTSRQVWSMSALPPKADIGTQLCAKSGHYAPQQKSPYSISSSASDINDAGIVSPSAFAVVRLMMNSNFVGCSTGKSDGFEPCNILCTYVAPRRKKSRTLAL